MACYDLRVFVPKQFTAMTTALAKTKLLALLSARKQPKHTSNPVYKQCKVMLSYMGSERRRHMLQS